MVVAGEIEEGAEDLADREVGDYGVVVARETEDVGKPVVVVVVEAIVLVQESEEDERHHC